MDRSGDVRDPRAFEAPSLQILVNVAIEELSHFRVLSPER